MRALTVSRQDAGVIAREAILALEPRAFLVRQLRQAIGDILDEEVINLERQQVRIRKIAIIVRIFLGAHRPGFTLVRIIEAGFLIHLAATFDQLDLTARFIFDGRLDKAERVHVLDLAARAQMAEIAALAKLLIAARLAHGHINVRTQITLLHVAVARAQRNYDGLELLDVSGCFQRRSYVRLGNDFHQRDAGAVEVHIGRRRVHVVDRLARILLKVKPFNPYREGIGRVAMGRLDINLDLALAHDGEFELADLIALRQVGIEIVLAVKTRPFVDLRLEAEPCAHCLLNAFSVDDRQHARHRRIDQ